VCPSRFDSLMKLIGVNEAWPTDSPTQSCPYSQHPRCHWLDQLSTEHKQDKRVYPALPLPDGMATQGAVEKQTNSCSIYDHTSLSV